MSVTLSKPFSATRSLPPDKSLFDLLDDPRASSALPSLRGLLRELEILTQQANIRLDEVVRRVQTDQSMAVRVLRMANSVYYAPIEPILDLRDAILFIGLNTFRGAVASTRCLDETDGLQQDVLDWKEFWRHSAVVGHVTAELAKHLRTRGQSDEFYYLMGLLHDIGKVVLARVLPDKFAMIYRAAAADGLPPAELERQALGLDHGQLGAWYLEKQGLPPALCGAVRFHHAHQPDETAAWGHGLLLRLADQLTRHHQLGQSGNSAPVQDPFASIEWSTYLQMCGVDAGEPLATELTEKMEPIAELVRATLG